MAKAYIVPTLVAGVLLTVIGLGLFFTNKSRITQFETAYRKDAATFVASEIERTESTLKEYTQRCFHRHSPHYHSLRVDYTVC